MSDQDSFENPNLNAAFLDEELSAVKKAPDSRTLHVFGKTFTFSLNDPIYQLCEPSKHYFASTGHCFLCEKPEEIRCDFCSKNFCKNCCPKLFPFLKSQPDPDSDGENCGLICKICETKMYIRNFHTEIDQEIKKLDNDIHEKQKEISVQKKKQFKLIATEQSQKQEIEEEESTHRENRELIYKQMEDVVAAIEMQTHENQKLDDIIREKRQKKHQKAKDIEVIQEDIQEIKQKIEMQKQVLQAMKADNEELTLICKKIKKRAGEGDTTLTESYMSSQKGDESFMAVQQKLQNDRQKKIDKLQKKFNIQMSEQQNTSYQMTPPLQKTKKKKQSKQRISSLSAGVPQNTCCAGPNGQGANCNIF